MLMRTYVSMDTSVCTAFLTMCSVAAVAEYLCCEEVRAGRGFRRHTGGEPYLWTPMEVPFQQTCLNAQKICVTYKEQFFQWFFFLFSRVWTSLTGNIQGIHLLTSWNMRMKGSEMILQNFVPAANQRGLTKIPMRKWDGTPIKTK